MKYKSHRPTFILRSSIKSYWLITPKYYVYISNSLQGMRQNHWTMKYSSQSPTFILRCSIKSYWLVSPRYHVKTSNNLQDKRQNHWTMKYRSQWSTFFWGQAWSHSDSLPRGIMFIHQKSSKYKAKSLNHEIRVTHFYFNTNFCLWPWP